MKKQFVFALFSFLFIQAIGVSAQAEVQQCAIYISQWTRGASKPFPMFTVYRSENLQRTASQASVGESSPAKAYKHLQKLIAQGLCVNKQIVLKCTVEPQIISTTFTAFKRTFLLKDKETYYVTRHYKSYSEPVSPYRNTNSQAQADLKKLRKLGICK